MSYSREQFINRETFYKKFVNLKNSGFDYSLIDFIEQVNDLRTKMGLLRKRISNIARTTTNKITFLSNDFKRVGLSFHCYENTEIDALVFPSISEAIIHDFIATENEAIAVLGEYVEKLEKTCFKLQHKIDDFNKLNPIQLVFLKIKSLFVYPAIINVSIDEKDIEELDSLLDKYNELDAKIWNYNLNDSLVSSLISYFVKDKGSISSKEFNLYMNRLGLEHLVPLI